MLPPDFTGVEQAVGEAPDVRCRSRSNRSSTHFNAERPRLAPADLLVAAGDGPAEAGVTAAQVQGNLDGVFQHTARAGLDRIS